MTQVFYTGDGSTREYDVSFPFIDQSFVKIAVDGADQDLTWLSASRVQLATAPAFGASVRLYRDTTIDEDLVEFQDGAVLTSEDLNLADQQILHKQQELEDEMSSEFARTLKVPQGEAGLTLPDAPTRASRFPVFDADGNLTTSNGTGADAGLREDLGETGLALTANLDPLTGITVSAEDLFASIRETAKNLAADEVSLAQQLTIQTIANAPASYDFAAGVYRAGGTTVDIATAVTSDRTTDAYWPIGQLPVAKAVAGSPRIHDGELILERPSTNIIYGTDFASMVVGVLGSGGALGADWQMSHPELIVEIESVSEVDGAPRARVSVERAGGTPVTQFPALHLGPDVGRVVPEPGRYNVHGNFRIVSKTGNVTPALQHYVFNADDTFAGSSDPQPLTEGPTVVNELATASFGAGQKSRATLLFETPTDTENFKVVFEMTLVQNEKSVSDANVVDQTSWIPTPAAATATRAEEVISLTAPDGTYDILKRTGVGGEWSDDVVATDTIDISRPSIISPFNVERVLALPSGLTSRQKTNVVFTLKEPVWTQPLFRAQDDFDVWWQIQAEETPSRPEHTFQKDASKTQVYRTEVRAGEHPDFDDARDGTDNANERAQFYQTVGDTFEPLALPMRTRLMFSMAMNIEDYNEARYCVLSALTATLDPGETVVSGPLYFQLNGDDEFTIETRTTLENPRTHIPSPTVHYRDPAFPRGRYVNLVWEVFIDPDVDGDGYLKVWRDGSQIVDYVGPIGFEDIDGPNWKLGPYRAASDKPFAVTYANFEGGVMDLTDRITNPLPII